MIMMMIYAWQSKNRKSEMELFKDATMRSCEHSKNTGSEHCLLQMLQLSLWIKTKLKETDDIAHLCPADRPLW